MTERKERFLFRLRRCKNSLVISIWFFANLCWQTISREMTNFEAAAGRQDSEELEFGKNFLSDIVAGSRIIR